MSDDLEVCRAAWELIDQHGDDALARAMDRARELAEYDQNEAALTWLNIAITVRRLDQALRRARERMH